MTVTHLRPPTMNPTAAISAYAFEVASFLAGSHQCLYGRDLDLRSAAARSYIERRNRLSTRLLRLLRR